MPPGLHKATHRSSVTAMESPLGTPKAKNKKKEEYPSNRCRNRVHRLYRNNRVSAYPKCPLQCEGSPDCEAK